MKLSKQQLQFAAILIIFLLAFYVKFQPQELSLVHSYPTTTDSSDGIYHALETEWIAQEEIHMHMRPYAAVGYTDVYDAVPVQAYIGAAFFTNLAGIESYDALFFFSVLSFAAAALATYLLLSKLFNPWVGLLASALILFPLEHFHFYMMRIGWYHQVASILFFPVVAYLAYRIVEHHRLSDYFLISFCVAASILAHTIEGLMLALFVLLVLFADLLKTKKLHPKGYLAFGIALVIGAREFWLNSMKTASIGGTFGGAIPAPFTPGLPLMTYSTYHVFTIAAALMGMAYLALSWNKQNRKKQNKGIFLLWAAVYLIGFFGNWLGIGFWFERIRVTAYLLIYPLAAIGTYFAISFIKKEIRPYAWIGALLLVLFLAAPVNADELFAPRQHLLNQEQYDALLWLRDNTPEDATVFFFDGYWQGTAEYSRRLGTDLRPDDLNRLAEPGFIEFWDYSTFGYHQNLIYKTGMFSFASHPDITGVNLCEMDYKIFVNYDQLAPVLQKYQDKLLETNKLVYNQNGIVILEDKDGQPGCLS